MVVPRSGDVLRIGRAASVQFASPMLFRVTRVRDHQPHSGWVWLDGYQLNPAGEAVAHRSIYVRIRGLHPAAAPGSGAAPGPAAARVPAPGRPGPR